MKKETNIPQKPGAPAAKELCVVALTRVYSLLHSYQTLTREIATPTVASFVEACLQIIKAPASGKPLRLPTALVETIIHALATLIPLYPSTLRPCVSHVREAIITYIAPTSSDNSVVPQSLSRASKRLLISLHCTAPKNGSSDEWVKAFNGYINDCHTVADQVFRAVQESWESSVGYHSQAVSSDGEPHGGGSAPDELPVWSGVIAGSERLVNCLGLVAQCFRSPTKTPVSVSLGAAMDLVSRISLLMPPIPGQEDRFQLNPAISREERDQLWSVIPDIHIAAFKLLLSMIQRLGRGSVPLARDMVDHLIRMFRATRHISHARKTAFTLARELLLVTGPTLDKMTVDSLGSLIQGCCRDLLDVAGYAPEPKHDQAQSANGAKGTKGKPAGNADAFLAPRATKATAAFIGIDSAHSTAANELLTVLLSHLPQKHLGPDSRGLVDRTAILCRNKNAMLASCLYPYKDNNGRYYPSILPFLIQQFPQDQEVEVLRSNLRAPKASSQDAWDPRSGLEALLDEPAEEAPIRDFVDPQDHQGFGNGHDKAEEIAMPSFIPDTGMDNATTAAQDSAFIPQATSTTTDAPAEVDKTSSWDVPHSPLKRKGDELDSGASKRLGKGKEVEMPLQPAPVKEQAREAGDGDSDSDSGGSVEIDMTFDDDDEDEGDDDME